MLSVIIDLSKLWKLWMKKLEKNPPRQVNWRNWRCYNLTTPAENVKILLYQSLLRLSKQYLFSTFSCTKKTLTPQNYFQLLGGDPCFYKQILERFELQFWPLQANIRAFWMTILTVFVMAEKPFLKSFFLTITIFILFRLSFLFLNAPHRLAFAFEWIFHPASLALTVNQQQKEPQGSQHCFTENFATTGYPEVCAR
jgi:hypothetical protein